MRSRTDADLQKPPSGEIPQAVISVEIACGELQGGNVSTRRRLAAQVKRLAEETRMAATLLHLLPTAVSWG